MDESQEDQWDNGDLRWKISIRTKGLAPVVEEEAVLDEDGQGEVDETLCCHAGQVPPQVVPAVRVWTVLLAWQQTPTHITTTTPIEPRQQFGHGWNMETSKIQPIKDINEVRSIKEY